MIFLRHASPTGKERHYDSFLAGLLGGYTVFGRTIHNSVSQQIVIYVAARVLLALAKLAVQPRQVGGGASGQGVQGGGGGWELFGNGEMRRTMAKNGWPVFASLSWAMVMYIFRWHPEAVQSSLRSSMSYMWVSLEAQRIWDYANVWTVTFSRTTGIPYGHYFGITNEQGGEEGHRVTGEDVMVGSRTRHAEANARKFRCIYIGALHHDCDRKRISGNIQSIMRQ